ncbi:MAG: hypothetical protein ACRDMW_07130, partial [Gaiellaceae bacterium]
LEEMSFTAQNIILTAAAAFAFFGGIGFYLRWSYLGWREGQRLVREALLMDRPLGDLGEREIAPSHLPGQVSIPAAARTAI